MQIDTISEEFVNRIRELVKAAKCPTLFNSYLSMACWLEHRPLLVLHDEEWLMLLAVDGDVEMMRPLGSYTKEQMSAAVRYVREQYPGKKVYVYGLDDASVEYFEKKRVDDVQLSYILSAQAIASQESKQLRNAVSKIAKSAPRVETLEARHRNDAKRILQTWAERKSDASTSFQNNLFDEFLERGDDRGHGFIVYLDDQPVGVTYFMRDQAFPQYALVLVNFTAKEVNGVTEFLLWSAASYAQSEWGCTFVNYGGADPKEDPGLHSFKKKFGWDHVLVEYSLKYGLDDESPQ